MVFVRIGSLLCAAGLALAAPLTAQTPAQILKGNSVPESVSPPTSPPPTSPPIAEQLSLIHI